MIWNYNPHANPMSPGEFASDPWILRFQSAWEPRAAGGPNQFGCLRIVLTERCNYACRFCYNEGVEGTEASLRPDEIDVVLDALGPRIRDLKLVGGEPLMHPDFDRIVGLCTARHPTTVTTNGSLLDRRRAAVRGLHGVTVSIQSLEPEVYRWLMGTSVGPERVLDAVARCIRDGTPVTASCVVTTRNISKIPWMTECLADLGIRRVDLHGILRIRPSDRDLYVPLAQVASGLEARWGAPEP